MDMSCGRYVSSIFFVIACISFVHAEYECPKETYYNQVTTRCDSCADICRTQGTEEDCHQLCPDYAPPTGDILIATVTPTCPQGQYYDSTAMKCGYCRDLCDNNLIQGTTKECKQKCPKYYNPPTDNILPATSTPLCSDDQYFDAVDKRCDHCRTLCDDSQIQSKNNKCKQKCPKYMTEHSPVNEPSFTQAGQIALAICLALVVSACAVVYVLMLRFCEQRLPHYLRLETCLPGISKTKKSVQCTEGSTTASSSTSSLEPGAPPEQCQVLMDHPQSGFTDMQYQRQSSSDVNNA